MDKVVRVYVAGPYSLPDPVANTRKAVAVGEGLWQQGYVPYVPHLTLLWHLLFPSPYDKWLELDCHWLAVCDVVLRLPGESKGADRECQLAVGLGIPVVHSIAELQKRFPVLPRKDGRSC